jgi:hypothetical protein
MELPTALSIFLIILMIVLALFFTSIVRSRREIDRLKDEVNRLKDKQLEISEEESDS